MKLWKHSSADFT